MARNFLGDDLVLRKRLAKMIQSRRKGVDEKQRVLSESTAILTSQVCLRNELSMVCIGQQTITRESGAFGTIFLLRV